MKTVLSVLPARKTASVLVILAVFLVLVLASRGGGGPAAASPNRPWREGEEPVVSVRIKRGPEPFEVATEKDTGTLIVEVEGARPVALRGTQTVRFDGATAWVGGVESRGRVVRIACGRGNGGEILSVGDRLYPGVVELVPPRKSDGSWAVVNRVLMELYLVGVIPGETVLDKFGPDALRAQAVAARTYAFFHLLTSPGDSLAADTSAQVYQGFTRDRRALQAVADTRGIVLTYDNRVFESFYHSTCGGATAGAVEMFGWPDIPPLRPARCGYCARARYARWEVEIPAALIERALAPVAEEHGFPLGAIRAIEPFDRGPGSHAAWVAIRHDKGRFEMDATQFRERLGELSSPDPRSTAFTVKPTFDGTAFVFTGTGWGHGVGLCQWGAAGLAANGTDWRGILSHYYGGSTLTRVWP